MRLRFELPESNGKPRKATVKVLEDGNIILTDAANLISMQEREKLAKRRAKKLNKDVGTLHEAIEAEWVRELNRPKEEPVPVQSPVIAEPDLSTRATAHEAEHLTDRGNAVRLVRAYGVDLRHCFPWRKWLVWDGQRWRMDDKGLVNLLANKVIVALYRWALSKLLQLGQATEDAADGE